MFGSQAAFGLVSGLWLLTVSLPTCSSTPAFWGLPMVQRDDDKSRDGQMPIEDRAAGKVGILLEKNRE